MKFRFIFIILIASALLFACSKKNKDEQPPPEDVNEYNEEDPNNNIENETVGKPVESESNNDQASLFESIPDVPQDAPGFIHQKVGMSASIDVWDESIKEDLLKEIAKLEPLPEDATEEQYDDLFKFMYYLVAEDFPNPEDTIKKWEFGAFGDPDLPDSRYHFKENYNIEVLLDASGSMGAYIGNKTMMQIAKESINDFMKQVPEDANVSFRVYGHVGKGTQEDKEKSCNSIDQVYGFERYDEAKFQKELDKIEPAGWTPLAEAMKQSEQALREFDPETNTNLMYVVSDGIETCGGDPIKVAEILKDSSAEPIINIIGFNMEADERAQLEEVARVSGAIFAPANNQEELKAEFERAEKVLQAWEEWKEDAIRDADYQRVSNSFDILGVTNEWGFKIDYLFVNLSQLGYTLEEEGIITFSQLDELNKRRNEVEKNLKAARQEIEEEMKEVSIEKIEELKKAIENKYRRQTTN